MGIDELFLSSQVAKMREECDRTVEALRGLVEQAELVKAETDYLEKTEHHDNYKDRSRSWARQAQATTSLVQMALAAKEVLHGGDPSMTSSCFMCPDGTIGLVRCPSCNTENYCLMVLTGTCYACGYQATKEDCGEPQ